ncbi:DNA polymerase III subunit gamma and tau, partial [Streptomyces zhihengii]
GHMLRTWPTASAPGSGAPAGPSAQAPRPAAAAPSAAPASPVAAQGAGQVRSMWPDILEAVKNRRRFTWILLSQNAQVAGFDGTTLQLGFLNAGARDNFASSGSEEVLKQALAEQFHVQWKVEAIIDPSGGAGGQPAPQGGGFQPSGGPGAPGPQGGYGQGRPPAPPAAPPAPPAPRPQAAAPAPAAPADRPRPAESYSPPPPPPVSIEDDVPEEDDPDLVDSALSGHDLIVRELGATVVEEYTNE